MVSFKDGIISDGISNLVLLKEYPMILYDVVQFGMIRFDTVFVLILYTPLKNYVVKQPQEKWACDFHDDAPPLSFQLQVTEDFF